MKLNKLDYIIKLSFDKEYGGYVADVVNLYGCMSQGKTKEQALKNAELAIRAYMEALTKTSDTKRSEFAKKSVESAIPLINA